jgi:hypothetical protein
MESGKFEVTFFLKVPSSAQVQEEESDQEGLRKYLVSSCMPSEQGQFPCYLYRNNKDQITILQSNSNTTHILPAKYIAIGLAIKAHQDSIESEKPL